MPQVRYVGPEPVNVPFIGRDVEVDELITITDEQFTAREWDIPGSWEIVTTPTTKKEKA
jgi:hypothetical protein